MILAYCKTKYREALSNYRGKISIKASLDSMECGIKIAQILQKRKPYLIGRVGWTEGYSIGKFLSEKTLPLKLQEKLMQVSGVFPATLEEFKRFSDVYIDAIKSADLLGLLNAPYHGWLLKKYAKRAELTALESLEPYFSECPWSWELRGLKVLVIHPFEESIRKQYLVREKIFVNQKVLPEFELKIIKTPLTITNNPTEFSSWSETLHHLIAQVENEEFDVAIIGCGAYGLPLGAQVKKMGKIGVHLGGATQLLFGIQGGRWAEHPAFIRYRSIMNEAWCSPLESERPVGWNKIENGCYW